ncbi:MAG: hypothetical protein ABNH21_04100 [Glaciecola sp.]
MTRLYSKILILFVVLISLVLKVEAEDTNLVGEWFCLQDSQIWGNLKAESKYSLVYEKNSSLVIQNGVITITESGSSSKSELEYTLEIEFSKHGVKHHSKIQKLDYTITIDQLQLLINGVAGFFPAEGEVVISESEIMDDNVLRTTYADGTVINCSRKV